LSIKLPTQTVLDATVRALTERGLTQVLTTVTQLVATSRGNLSELDATTAQLKTTQKQLVQAESSLSKLKLRQAEVEKQVLQQTSQAVRLESDLRLAQTQLAQSGTELASLQKTIGDLQERLKAAGGQPASKPVVDLVSELRADAANLFAKPIRAADSSTVPGVVVDGLEFEIRGGLVRSACAHLQLIKQIRRLPASSAFRSSQKCELSCRMTARLKAAR
jgi:hypothetical protein